MIKTEILEGFRAIANEKMAETVRKISIAKGYATTDYALVAFGGAGGLHVCGIAELLGISKILLPLDAGLLSAYGISQAQVERFAEASVLEIYDKNLDKELERNYQDLATKAMLELEKDGIEFNQSYIKHRYVYLRLSGQTQELYSYHFQKNDCLPFAFLSSTFFVAFVSSAKNPVR